MALQKGLAENALKQLQESEQRSITYAKRVLELQEGVQNASDAMKKCHAANVQLTADKKVCMGGGPVTYALRVWQQTCSGLSIPVDLAGDDKAQSNSNRRIHKSNPAAGVLNRT